MRLIWNRVGQTERNVGGMLEASIARQPDDGRVAVAGRTVLRCVALEQSLLACVDAGEQHWRQEVRNSHGRFIAESEAMVIIRLAIAIDCRLGRGGADRCLHASADCILTGANRAI